MIFNNLIHFSRSKYITHNAATCDWEPPLTEIISHVSESQEPPFDWLLRVSIIPPRNVSAILIGHNKCTFLSKDPIGGKYRLVVRQSHEGKKSRSETDSVYVTAPHGPDAK